MVQGFVIEMFPLLRSFMPFIVAVVSETTGLIIPLKAIKWRLREELGVSQLTEKPTAAGGFSGLQGRICGSRLQLECCGYPRGSWRGRAMWLERPTG